MKKKISVENFNRETIADRITSLMSDIMKCRNWLPDANTYIYQLENIRKKLEVPKW